MIVLTAAKATIIDAVTPTSPPGRLSRLHWIQGGAQPSSITLACTMSSTSSSPSPNRSASPNTPLTPPPLPAADGYMNALRLDPIIEHVQADHVQRTRAHSVSSVSFKGGAKPPPQAPAVAQPKAKPAPRVRASSPPPSRQVSPFLFFFFKDHRQAVFRIRKERAWGAGLLLIPAYTPRSSACPHASYARLHCPSYQLQLIKPHVLSYRRLCFSRTVYKYSLSLLSYTFAKVVDAWR